MQRIINKRMFWQTVFCLLGLAQIGSAAVAADYLLDASTMAVGATAGENLVVQEGCLDPTKTSCTDKVRYLTTSSPTKVGNVQVLGSLTGDFEIVVTADFASSPKGIKILTADNKGFGLSFSGDTNDADFAPNGIGEGRSCCVGLPGWNGDSNFNEVKIAVQNGVANVYTNGQVYGAAITFDPGVVFERVAIEGIKSDDRLSDIKVRGITTCTGTGTGGSTSARVGGISTNAMVGTDPVNYMIAGIFVNGGSKKVLVRASSVDGVLDPKVTIQSFPDGTVLYTNSSWGSDSSAAQVQQLGYAPAKTTDAAMIVTLPIGLFTFTVSPEGVAGKGIIEVYEVDSL